MGNMYNIYPIVRFLWIESIQDGSSQLVPLEEIVRKKHVGGYPTTTLLSPGGRG